MEYSPRYSLRDVPNERIDAMIQKIEKTSEIIGSTLKVLLGLTGREAIDRQLWNLAVDVGDGKKSLTLAIEELRKGDPEKTGPPTSVRLHPDEADRLVNYSNPLVQYRHKGMRPPLKRGTALMFSIRWLNEEETEIREASLEDYLGSFFPGWRT